MKLDPSMTPEEIATLLREQAERIYGPDRAIVLSEQIEHLSRMLADVGTRELELTDSEPDSRGDR